MPFEKPPLDEITIFGVPVFVLGVLLAIIFWCWHEWYFRFGPGRADKDDDADGEP